MTTYIRIKGKVYAVEDNPRRPSNGPFIRTRHRARESIKDMEHAEIENRKLRRLAKSSGYHTKNYTLYIRAAVTVQRYLRRVLAIA